MSAEPEADLPPDEAAADEAAAELAAAEASPVASEQPPAAAATSPAGADEADKKRSAEHVEEDPDDAPRKKSRWGDGASDASMGGRVTCGNVTVERVTWREARGVAGFAWDAYRQQNVRVTIVGEASVTDLIRSVAVRAHFHATEGVCRVWLCARIPDGQTRSNVDHLIMRPAGFTPSPEVDTHRRRAHRGPTIVSGTIRLAAHQRPDWEPARPLTEMVDQAQRSGRRPPGNVQGRRATQEDREVLVVEVSRDSPGDGTVVASPRARGFRAAVGPLHQPGGLWPAPWESQPFPWASTARNANGTPRFPALGWADAPWGTGGAVSFSSSSDN